MSVVWIGKSRCWPSMPQSIPRSGFAFPLVETAVLPVAFDTRYAHLRRLSKQAAIACSSRLALRVTLADTGLNPSWYPYPWRPGVLKAPASRASGGVILCQSDSDVSRLAKYVPELAQFGIWEQYIEGPCWELDGFVIGGQISFFHPLREHWDRDHERIVRYERAEPRLPGIREAVAEAVRAIGIDDCVFCFELREAHSGWKVVDAHSRLGEDVGLAKSMWDRDVLKTVEEAANGSQG